MYQQKWKEEEEANYTIYISQSQIQMRVAAAAGCCLWNQAM